MKLEKYTLENYIEVLETYNLITEKNLDAKEKTKIDHIEYDSKAVQTGTLFVCKGANFKQEYLEEAIERGAVAYVSEVKYHVDLDIPYILVSDIDKAMAPIAKKYYNDPAAKLKIVGVGGTKGKTTTVYYIKAMLDKQLKARGKKPAGLISSIQTFDGQENFESINTTPVAMDLYKDFRKMVDAGLEYVAMEVSSQALKYHRTDGVHFDVGIFLNIDEDHISPIEHPNFEDYLQSKAKMFAQTDKLIVNNETQEADYIFEKAKDAQEVYTFSLKDKEADYYAYNIETVGLENYFTVKATNFNERFALSMPGNFNIENATSAIGALILLGFSLEGSAKALQNTSVPGRMRIMQTDDKQVIGVADFAHNRLSFERLITSMRKAYPGYKIISVFGAPGGKSLGRREELGTVAGKYSDHAYITTDDPAFEDVLAISEEIAQYVRKEDTPYRIIIDRTLAIQTALQHTEEKTIVLVIGKGHEETMIIKGKYVPIQTDESIIQEWIQEYDENNK